MNTGLMLAAVILLSNVAAQQPEAPAADGAIHGTVIDQNGQPAKEVGLTAYPLGVPLGAVLPHTRTDQEGKFRFADIPWWGKYTVAAEDEDAGYSSSAQRSDLDGIQEVTLSAEHPEAEFDFQLPPKAGFLNIHLTNRNTGEVIKAVMVRVTPADDPKELLFSMSCLSNRPILIPPDEDLLLHVSSRGFREWKDSDPDGMPIRIRSGSRLTLEVGLDPAP